MSVLIILRTNTAKFGYKAEQVIGAGGAVYDVCTNNCQHFVNRLLNKISPGHTVYETLAPPAVKYTSAAAALEISLTPTVGAGPGGTSRKAGLYTGATDETPWWEAEDETRILKVGRETPASKAKAHMENITPLITVLKSVCHSQNSAHCRTPNKFIA